MENLNDIIEQSLKPFVTKQEVKRVDRLCDCNPSNQGWWCDCYKSEEEKQEYPKGECCKCDEEGMCRYCKIRNE